MSVTQQEIADKLNVSRSLVARALRGHTAVARNTRRRIETTARELGYDEHSNRAARQLISSRYGKQLKTNTLAVVFPQTISSPRRVPFFTSMIEGMETAAESLDMDVCICLMRSEKLPRLIQTHSVDGVIVLGDASPYIVTLKTLGLPIVTFQSHCKGAHSVIADDRKGAYSTTRHLLALGHRHIAFLGVQKIPADALRLRGYQDAMKEAGALIREEWIDTSLNLPNPTSNSYCDGCNQCAACLGWALLRDKNGGSSTRLPNFSAIVCHNDPVAMGVIDHARRDGLEIPRDLSVTGFDDVSSQYHFHPEVTSIRFPREQMGAGAVCLLHQAIEGGDSAKLSREVFPTELVVHQSTAAPATQE